MIIWAFRGVFVGFARFSWVLFGFVGLVGFVEFFGVLFFFGFCGILLGLMDFDGISKEIPPPSWF